MRSFLCAGLLSLCCVTFAQSITFEVYELNADGTRYLLEKGVKNYGIGDLVVRESFFGEKFWLKELPVTQGFAIGASVHRHPELIGFGLWAKQRTRWYELWKDEGFSWDWFSRENFPIYRKLQGPGRVRTEIVKGSNYEELTSVEFLEDVTLRLNARPWFFFSSSGHTHHVVVRKGSVLKLAP